MSAIRKPREMTPEIAAALARQDEHAAREAARVERVVLGVIPSIPPAPEPAKPITGITGLNRKQAKALAAKARKDAARVAAGAADAGVVGMEWQPIETAPKDRRIWAFFPFKGDSYAIRWDRNDYEVEENWTLDDGESATLSYDPPTHWMPLPEPPVAS